MSCIFLIREQRQSSSVANLAHTHNSTGETFVVSEINLSVIGPQVSLSDLLKQLDVSLETYHQVRLQFCSAGFVQIFLMPGVRYRSCGHCCFSSLTSRWR